MPSPVLPSDFGDAIPSANADFCDRFTKWLAVPQKLRDLFSYWMTSDGRPSPAFQAEIAVYSAPTGMVAYFLTQNVGDGWLYLDGRAVSRTAYAALFQAIGSRYGEGDASTTFNLPDARGRSLIGAGAGAANADFDIPALTSRDINEAYVGEEAHVLTESENAEHKHPIGLLVDLSLTPTNASAILRDQSDKTMSKYGSTAATVGSGTYIHGDGNSGQRSEINVGPSGGTAGHNNIQPCLIGFPYIKT